MFCIKKLNVKIKLYASFLTHIKTNTANTSCSFIGPFFNVLLAFLSTILKLFALNRYKVLKNTSKRNC